jgi:hypothetical protein
LDALNQEDLVFRSVARNGFAACLGLCMPVFVSAQVAPPSRPPNDSAFAATQSRGRQVMGVDQYTSTHVFESLPDGGRIVLRRDSIDATGEATIRAHLADIREQFTKGDFTLPGVVHATTVPGTAVMVARKDRIRYVVEPLARGAQLRIITRDAEALKAVHEFLAFQRMDHRAAGHDHQ